MPLDLTPIPEETGALICSETLPCSEALACEEGPAVHILTEEML